MFIKEFDQEIEPYILENTPDVISVGMRCMRYGFTFVWPSGSPPYFILPDGRRVHLSVDGDIPYLALGRVPAGRVSPETRRVSCVDTLAGRTLPPLPLGNRRQPTTLEAEG